MWGGLSDRNVKTSSQASDPDAGDTMDELVWCEECEPRPFANIVAAQLDKESNNHNPIRADSTLTS